MSALGRVAAGTWGVACRFPLAMSALFVIVSCGFTLTSRPLWYSDELRYGEVYRNLVDGGHWWLLHLNGVPYPDKPPVFFWLAGLLDLVPGIAPPTNLFLTIAVSAFLFLAATDILGRTIGLPRETRAATQLVLLSTLFVALLQHYVRMDLFFATLMLLSMAALWSHFVGGAGPRRAYLGFALAGLAVLVKGPLGFLFPVLSVGAFVLWRGEGRRLWGRGLGLGLLICAGVVAVWMVGLVVLAGPDYLVDRIFGQQVIGRAKDAYRHQEAWHYYLRALPVAFLPWTAVLLTLSPRRIAALDWWRNRRSAGPVAFAAVGAVSMLLFLSLLSGKSFVYVLPALPLLAMIAGHLLVTDAPRARLALVVAAALLALFGLAILVAAVTDDRIGVAGPLVGAVILATAAPLAWGLRARPVLALTGMTAVVAAWIVTQALITLPDISPKMTTRAVAQALGRYAAEGYTPVAYRTYSGVFGFYLGRSLEEVADADRLAELLAGGEKIALVTGEKTFAALGDSAVALKVVDRSENVVAGDTFVIALHD